MDDEKHGSTQETLDDTPSVTQTTIDDFDEDDDDD